MKKIIINPNNESKTTIEAVQIEAPTKPKKDRKGKKKREIILEQDDFTLEKENECFITKKAKSFQASFSSDLSQTEVVSLKKDDHLLSMTFHGRKAKIRKTLKAKAKIEKSKIVYADFEDGIDLTYQCQTNGVKESLIIHKKQSSYDFDFTLHIGDLSPLFNEKESTIELQKDEKSVYRILSPFMTDSNGVRSDDCSYEIVQNENELKVVLHCDESWMNAESRAFPVIVDPTIEVISSDLFEIAGYYNGSKIESSETLQLGYIKRFPPTYFYYSLHISVQSRKLKKAYPSVTNIKFSLAVKELGSELSMTDEFILKHGQEEIKRFHKNDFEEDFIIDLTDEILNSNAETDEFIFFHENDGYSNGTNQESNQMAQSYASVRPPSDQGKINCVVQFYDDIKKPHMILNVSDNIVENAPERAYSIGKAETRINLYDGNVVAKYDDAISLKQNQLIIALEHDYDYRRKDDNSVYFGKGWKSNLHQALKKEKDRNAIGYREIKYVDGNGKSHYFHEFWYYLDEAEEKHYIDKSAVYLDADYKYKYLDENGKAFEVKYEITNEDNLTLMQGASINEFPSKPRTRKKYFLSFGYGRREVSISEEIEHHYQFYYLEPGKSKEHYVLPSEVLKNTNGTFHTISSSNEYLFLKSYGDSMPLVEQDGKYGFIFKSTDGYGVDTEVFCPLEEEIIAEEYEYSDIYHSDELANVDGQISSIEEYIGELEISKQDILQSIQSGYDQLRLQGVIHINQDNLYRSKKELSEKYNRFYDTTGSDCEYAIIDSYGFTIDEEELTFTGVNSSNIQQASNCLDAFTRLYKLMSENMAQSDEVTSHALEEMSTNASLVNMIQSLARYESNFAEIERKLENYQIQLEDLKCQRQALIDEQKKQANDFILDQEGNTLGFDGYGRLIVIQDKYENKIEIEFGYEKENEGRILSVSSDTQNIQFHYDKETGLLSSITDPQGRMTKYVYDENDHLISIIGNDGRKSIFNYTNRFKFTSPMLESIEIMENDDGSVSVKTYCLNGTISEGTVLTGEEEQQLLKEDRYLFKSDLYQTEITDGNTGKKSRLYFDEEGRILDEETEKSLTHQEYEDGKKVFECEEDLGREALLTLTGNQFVEEGHVYNLGDQSAQIKEGDILGFKVRISETTVPAFAFSVVTIQDGEEQIEWKKEVPEGERERIYIIGFRVNRKKPISLGISCSNHDGSVSSLMIESAEVIVLEDAMFFEYDEEKRIIKEQDGYTIKEYFEYDEKNHYHQIKETNIYGEEVITHYAFDAYERLTYIEDSKGNVEEYYYDEKGNCIEKRVYNKKDASLMKVEKVTYDDQGNPASSIGQIKGQDGSYPKEEITYLPNTNIESKIKGFNGETTHYQYDYNTGNVLSISSSSKGINNSTSFTYNYDLLTSMSHHGMKVAYEYDGRGRKTKIILNGEEVVWNTFTDHFDGTYTDPFNEDTEASFQGSYTNSTTADGLFTETYTDEDGKQIISKYSSSDTYGANQYLYSGKDLVTEIQSRMTYRDTHETYCEATFNTYDEFDEIVRQEKKVNDISEVILENHYDESHRWIASSDIILSQEDYRLNMSNTYNEEHQLTSVKVREGIVGEEEEESFLPVSETALSYDALGRVIHQNLHANKIDICHEYSYLQQDENTLDLVAEDITKIKITQGSQITYLTEASKYTYDVNGNIIDIESDENHTRYQYDSLNRLIREDNPYFRKTYVYQYDQAGNILLKKTYPYNIIYTEIQSKGTVIEYVYDCEKRDRLIAYDGKTIAYDSMGRPTTYKDDEYEWNNQGQLTYIVKENGDEIEYLYDTNGIRRKKIVNEIETSYVTNGTQILAIKKGNETMIFRYVLNKLVGFNYNNGSSSKEYIYQRNIQGDIIGIFDDEGNQVGGYAYDAYGNHVITIDEGGIATLNPFRYRGYYWDEESKLYYLNSRYYDPETGRFISPDVLSVLNETKGQINGLNLYMYCADNPVMYIDGTGYFPLTILLFGLLIGAFAAGAFDAGKQLIQNGWDFSSLDLGSIANSAIVGGALGLSLALGVVYLGPVIAGVAGASGKAALIAFCVSSVISFGAGALGYAAEEWFNGRTPDFGTAMMHGGFVMLEGMISFGVGGITGSVGTIGKKGKPLISKEWWLKLIFGQEFTKPSKILIDLIRNNI